MGPALLPRVIPSWTRSAEHRGPFPLTAGLHSEQSLASPLPSPQRLQSLVVRDLARAALRQLGPSVPAHQPIGRGRHGAPDFPAGIVGSLTHTREYAGAVVAVADGAGLGIDVERSGRVGPGHHVFATRGERTMLASRMAAHAHLPWPVLLFSAKESVYKAVYSLEHRRLTPHAMDIDLSPGGTFVAQVAPLPGVGTGPTAHGRWVVDGGLLATCAVVCTDQLHPLSTPTPEALR